MSLARHLIRGSTANLIDHAMKVGAVFYLTPLMVSTMQKEGYGVWLLAMNVLGYFLLLDLGVSFASIRQYAAALGAGDAAGRQAILEVSSRFFRWIGAAMVVLTAIFTPLMPWIAPSSLPAVEVMTPLAVCGVVTALRFFLRMPLVLLRAQVRYDLLALCSMGKTLTQLVLMTLALRGGYGLAGAAVAYATSDAVELLLQVYFARGREASSVKVIEPEQRKRTSRELFTYSRSILMVSLGESLRNLVNPVLVGRLGGVAQVPVYSVGMRLITILEDVINSLFGGQVLAVFSQLHGAGKAESLELQFRRVTALTACFSGWAVVGVVCFGRPFFQRWLGPGFEQSYELLLILAAPYAIKFMQYPAHSLLYAMNRQQWLMRIVFTGGMISIVLSVPLGIQFGLRGVVMGAAIETLLMYTLVMPWLVSRVVLTGAAAYLFRDVIWPALKGVSLPLLFMLWAFPRLEPDYFVLTCHVAGYVAVFLISLPWLVLDADMRQIVRRALWRG
jgi:O-antigen/teichoic acid export membrane protein